VGANQIKDIMAYMMFGIESYAKRLNLQGTCVEKSYEKTMLKLDPIFSFEKSY